jgi:hypothetical protein
MRAVSGWVPMSAGGMVPVNGRTWNCPGSGGLTETVETVKGPVEMDAGTHLSLFAHPDVAPAQA